MNDAEPVESVGGAKVGDRGPQRTPDGTHSTQADTGCKNPSLSLSFYISSSKWFSAAKFSRIRATACHSDLMMAVEFHGDDSFTQLHEFSVPALSSGKCLQLTMISIQSSEV